MQNVNEGEAPQLMKISLNADQLIDFHPLAVNVNPQIEATIVCVVETGICKYVKRSNQKDPMIRDESIPVIIRPYCPS